jgi:hypothetical protein
LNDMQAAEAMMQQSLSEVGFDFARPEPTLEWAAFRAFAARPLPGIVTINVGVECNHVADRDGVLWLELARSLEGPGGVGWRCGCLLSRPVPVELVAVSEALWWWAEHGTLTEWAADAERLPAFAACLALDGWQWDGFSG